MEEKKEIEKVEDIQVKGTDEQTGKKKKNKKAVIAFIIAIIILNIRYNYIVIYVF